MDIPLRGLHLNGVAQVAESTTRRVTCFYLSSPRLNGDPTSPYQTLVSADMRSSPVAAKFLPTDGHENSPVSAQFS